MSRERLQEYFSDLYEGTLDPGLVQTIRARFDSDPDLKADYAKFSEAFQAMDGMKDEVIQIPTHLSARIFDRLDAAAPAESVRNPFASSKGLGWFKSFGLAAIAGCALLGSIASVVMKGSGSNSTASVIPNMSPQTEGPLDTIGVKVIESRPHLVYQASGPKSVEVSMYGSDKPFVVHQLDSNRLNTPLVNPNDAAVALQVKATGDDHMHIILVPGSRTGAAPAGEGNVVEFLRSAADRYGKVIYFKSATSRELPQLRWDLQGDNVQAGLSVLDQVQYSISSGADGVVTVESH